MDNKQKKKTYAALPMNTFRIQTVFEDLDIEEKKLGLDPLYSKENDAFKVSTKVLPSIKT